MADVPAAPSGAPTGNRLGISVATNLPLSGAGSPPVSVSAGSATASTGGMTSPRNEFYVSQRAADYEPSRVDTLSLEEQEILANIQDLQLQLMQVRSLTFVRLLMEADQS